MTASPVFGTMVDRLCRIRSGTVDDELPFPIDSAGFVVASSAYIGPVEGLIPGAFVTTSVAAHAGALVLLGEPGVGKSTEFEKLGDCRCVRHLEVRAAD